MRAMANLSRREMLEAGAAWAGMALLGNLAPAVERLAASEICPSAGPLGELVGLVPLSPERGQVLPFGEMYGGSGLDARLLNDLSLLEPDKLITPNERFFIRTACPPSLLGRKGAWDITVGGLASKTGPLALDNLMRDARPMGAHITECSGNANPRNFGLLSVAEWDGIPLAPIIDRLGPKPGATGVLVSGVDHEESASGRSVPTASWVYPLDALERMGAFLAVRMNGQPLPPDHGAPVRLAIPGWYGCTWIKWVNEIRLVGPEEPATAQMREFAARTEQTGQHELARDYKPAEIDLTGTPVRVEKRRIDGRLEYRIVGIIWGGNRTVDRMRIGFGKDEWTDLPLCPAPKTHRVWSMWEYRWRPAAPGLYDIALKSADPSIRTRRLDRGYYMRQVRIDEV
jgi:DMSO/TMAO reductase YedYZ molybdopterin-dependent catalytic subunit